MSLTRRAWMLFFACVIAGGFLFGCVNDSGDHRENNAPVRFAVFADPHVYDSGLGATGEAFAAYEAKQFKMIAQSEAVFEEALRRLIAMDPRPEFLLVPGDLTKDGAEQSHMRVVESLHRVKDAGIDVYVVPGNHDVSNPHAFGYGAHSAYGVYSPDAAGFVFLYESFGYGAALSRDPHSLSYAAEPAPGLLLLAIDSCRYRESVDTPVVGGKISRETLAWLVSQLETAREDGKMVIAMMHHGIVEHVAGQGAFLPDYLIADWERIGYELAAAGMGVIFTGHYHTQNITGTRWEDGTSLLEIQTGSLVNHPVPFRVVELDTRAREISVQSFFIEDIPAGYYPDEYCCFGEFAYRFAEDAAFEAITRELTARHHLDAHQIDTYAPMLVQAVLDHVSGDENPSTGDVLRALTLASSSDPALFEIGLVLLSLYNDPPPADNRLEKMSLPY